MLQKPLMKSTCLSNGLLHNDLWESFPLGDWMEMVMEMRSHESARLVVCIPDPHGQFSSVMLSWIC